MTFYRAMLSLTSAGLFMFAMNLGPPYPFADLISKNLWEGIFILSAIAIQLWAIKPQSWWLAISSCALFFIACSSRMTVLFLAGGSAPAWFYFATLSLAGIVWSLLIREFSVDVPLWVYRFSDRGNRLVKRITVTPKDL